MHPVTITKSAMIAHIFPVATVIVGSVLAWKFFQKKQHNKKVISINRSNHPTNKAPPQITPQPNLNNNISSDKQDLFSQIINENIAIRSQ